MRAKAGQSSAAGNVNPAMERIRIPVVKAASEPYDGLLPDRLLGLFETPGCRYDPLGA